jgi:cobalt transporter subunit CbtA
MFKNLVTSAVFAGVAAGILAAALQFWFVTPLLMEGELYESGAKVHFAVDGSPQSDVGAPPIWEEPGRNLLTIGFNMITFTAFALLMVAGFALSQRAGFTLSARTGLIWGLAGFISFQLAPAFGLPPVLPGSIGPEVELRQIWWIGTVLATALGLTLIAFGPLFAGVIGGALILLPHLIGAPQLDTYFGVAAPELVARFVTASLCTSAIAWCALGLIAAHFWTRAQEA